MVEDLNSFHLKARLNRGHGTTGERTDACTAEQGQTVSDEAE